MATFKEAFRSARNAGKKVFSWNGKQFNTKLKEEVSSGGPKARPASTAVGSPKKRPAAAVQGPETRVQAGLAKIAAKRAAVKKEVQGPSLSFAERAKNVMKKQAGKPRAKTKDRVMVRPGVGR
jgi:hypothetical protein